MGENHSFLALDWVKGEIEETLKQARQALEAHVENPDDPTRMRFCLAYLHQVYGTLHMVEFYGAALLAEEMEKLCQALVTGKVARVEDGQEVLMRAILQVPPYLERVKASRRDLPVVLLPLLNDLRAVRGEPLLSETALFSPDLAAGERAPIQIAGPTSDPGLLKKIRQMYQVALLGIIRQDKVPQNLAYMDQVFSRLEKIAGASPMRELWQVAAALVEGLTERSIETGTSVKMLLGHVDRQLRSSNDSVEQHPPTELMKNLLYYVAKSPGQTPRLRAVKDLYRLDDALPADNLVNEERARMAGPDREAIKSVVDALCDELARVKDVLDIFVRSSERKLADLGVLVPILKQVADTVAMLGLGQPRRILQEQIEAIDSITASGELPKDGKLLDVAGALLYVEATLNGMVMDKTVGGGNPGDVIDLSGQKQLSEAQAAVLRESRGALERSKDAVIEFIASQWNPVHLEAIPEQINTVRGGLTILNLPRPAELLGRASQYISERLLKDQYRPDWPEMDTLADIITSVEYYLERVANDGQGGEAVLDIAEAGLNKLGFSRTGVLTPKPEPVPQANADHGEWSEAGALDIENELRAPDPVPAEPLPVEVHEDEVLAPSPALTPDASLDLDAEFEATLMASAIPAALVAEKPTGPAAESAADVAASPLSLDSNPDALDDELSLDDFSLGAGHAPASTAELPAALSADAGLDELDFDDLTATVRHVEPEASVSAATEVSHDADAISLEDLELHDDTLHSDHASLQLQAEPEAVATSHPLEGDISLDDFGLDSLTPASSTPVSSTPVPSHASALTVPVMPVAPVAEPELAMPDESGMLLDELVLDDFTLDPVSPAEFTASAAAADELSHDDLNAETVVMAAEEEFDLDAFTLDSAPGEPAAVAAATPVPEHVELVAEPVAAAALPEPAPAVAEPPKKPMLPVLVTMPEDDFTFDDEEIREIFVEEAQEVLETINEYFPRWAGNFEDRNALVEFRRGFHTLKGSGRMVGAKVVGELAWSIENMLNKVRDNILAPNQAMVNLISECLVVLPGLVEDFQARQLPRINTGTLMATAEALSRGEIVSTVDVARAAEDAHGSAEPELAAEEDEAGDTDATDFDALAASLAPAPRVDTVVAELPEEAFQAEPAAELAELESLMAEDAPLASLDEGSMPATADVDPVLLEIFTSEADAHLHEIQTFLNGIEAYRNTAPITDQVLRSLHTLKGSAGMAGIAPVADVAAPMEHLFKDLRNQGVPAQRDHLKVLQEAHDLIRSSIEDLQIGGSGRVGSSAELVARVRVLDQERLSLLEKTERQHLGLDDSANWTEAVTAATAGRVASFMALGLDHVLDAPWELDNWLQGMERDEKLQVLREELLRLGPAARRADLEPLALVAERLASLYSRLSEHTLALDPYLVNDLCAGHDEIINIFDTLAASQTVEANNRILETLLDWLEAPATPATTADELVTPNDEPMAASFAAEEPRQGLAESMNDGAGAEPFVGGLSDVADEGLDAELLEIFLEEAEEVLAAADEELNAWRAKPADKTPLGALQRQLHTLKGGARLAEIKSLGDLAHELEFLYEGLVDDRYQSSPELVDLVQRCHDRLADMVTALRDGGRCQPAPELLNAITNFRRNAGTLGDVESPAPESDLTGAVDTPLTAEPLPDVATELPVDEAPAAPEPVRLPEATPEYEEHIPWEQHEPASRDAAPAMDAEDVMQEDMGDELEYIDADPSQLAEEAPVPEAEPAEAFAQELQQEPQQEPQQAGIPAAGVEVGEAENTEALFAEFFPGAALTPEPAPASVAAFVPAPAAATPTHAAHTDVDPELLEIFLEEAGELVDSTSEQLGQWLSDTNNTLPVQQLQRGLHTLKGGARMAEITPLGDLAHQMEDLYEGLCDGIYTVTPPLLQLLHRCHDRLALAVEALNKAQACPDTTDLIAQLRHYIADPHNYQDVPTTVSLTPHAPAPQEVLAEVEPLPEPAAPVAPPPPRAIEAAEVPEQVDADILEIFFEESEELSEGIEQSISDWLGARDKPEPMEALMRHLHTLKGGARLAGLKDLGNLAHDFETDLVYIQQGTRNADDAFFNGLHGRLEEILKALKSIRQQAQGVPVAPPVVEPAPQPEVPPVASAPEPITAPVVAAEPVQQKPAASSLAALMESAPQNLASGERAVPPPMSGSFRNLQVNRGPQEMIRVPSDLLEKLVNLAGETSITRSRVEMGVHGFAQTVEEMGATIQRLADQLRRMDSEMETQIISRHNEEAGAKYEEFDPLEMDQYSSLNQLSKALSESASDLLDLKSTLIDKARDTETLLLQQSRINTELQEGLMRSRMVPFSRLVPRLKRIVRQTGQEVGKPADLDVINAEGEMDRTLLERVVAPLEHMLRNAVDHGIEKPEGRAAAGKPAQGKVTLTLAREGGEVVLTLTDDGAGINIAAVRRKAIERGLIAADSDIGDAEVIQFIFHAGFSTAEKVTQISGRGVGMDVVQSEIKQMGGVVSIASNVGQGTVFTIRLPFTVAVNRALMVRIGEDVYAIPLSQIEGIVRASPYELEAYYSPGAPLFEYAGVAYRLSYLGEFVHGVKSPNLLGHVLPLPVLLVRGGEQRVAIQVDQLIGSREIVVKSVGMQLSTVAGISGATILGDGSVVIILDVVAMLRAAAISQPRISVGGQAPALAAPVEVVRARTVMVVDDSVTVRKVTSRLLERHGYQVLLAKDGMDAIAKLEDQKPDLMLLDIEMPRMDGFEVASLVRHNPNLEDLPIIMITSRTGEKHRERAFQIGVNCYMGKPFQEQQLLDTIAELLPATVR